MTIYSKPPMAIGSENFFQATIIPFPYSKLGNKIVEMYAFSRVY